MLIMLDVLPPGIPPRPALFVLERDVTRFLLKIEFELIQF